MESIIIKTFIKQYELDTSCIEKRLQFEGIAVELLGDGANRLELVVKCDNDGFAAGRTF